MPRASSIAFRGPPGPHNVKTTPGHPGKPFEVELCNRYTVLTAVGDVDTKYLCAAERGLYGISKTRSEAAPGRALKIKKRGARTSRKPAPQKRPEVHTQQSVRTKAS